MRARYPSQAVLATATAIGLIFAVAPAFAGMDEARKYVETEFQPSTLSKEDQLKEMEWFVSAAKPITTNQSSNSRYKKLTRVCRLR